jgi:NAD(P)-dependent dehydrogenase (short-subunit alcohol dehydrogenase family)
MTASDSHSSARLAGRTAIVTGGGSGIGRAIAQLFARHGARVAILDLAGDDSAREIAAAGGRCVAIECDVSNQAKVDHAFACVTDELGPLDVLVNNAGVAAVGTVEATTEADLDRVYAVNVKGVYNCLRAGVAAMKGRGGAIINMASVASSVGVPERFAYSMSKGAVLTMTYSVASDYVSAGIRCNAVSPARVHTPFVDGYLAKHYPGREAEMFEKLSRTQPVGRMGEPWEVAELVLFLASDAAKFITGSNFAVDGGFVSLKT